MRFDTHRISVYVVDMLLSSGAVRRIDADSGDLIQFTLGTGDQVNLYLIEDELTPHELRTILDENAPRNIASLFILWCDMLLPRDGAKVVPPLWMQALLALYGDLIYAYDAFGPDLFIFPVYFDGTSYQRTVRYGLTVNPLRLATAEADVTLPFLRGRWRVAGFFGDERRAQRPPVAQATVSAYYVLLGLEAGATRADVKLAYRRLARQLHPDVNPNPDASARMQALNEAYRAVLAELDGEAND